MKRCTTRQHLVPREILALGTFRKDAKIILETADGDKDQRQGRAEAQRNSLFVVAFRE